MLRVIIAAGLAMTMAAMAPRALLLLVPILPSILTGPPPARSA